MSNRDTNIVKQNSNFVNAKLDSNIIRNQTKYQKNGLTYVSNNDAVIPRDQGGNIIMQEDADNNPMLIIEPISTKITNNSMLKILDTQFTYFKFPTRFPIETTLDLDLDTNIDLTTDTIYARYRPSEARRISTGGEDQFSGILMDFVEDGVPQKSTNQYFITKEIKDSGIDLRFRIKIEHRFDSANYGYGTAYFSILKNSPKTGLDRIFKGPFANVSSYNNQWGYILQYEVQTLNLDLIIRNDEFNTGDYFQIGAIAGQNNDTDYHTINPIQTYWVITDASKNVDEWNQEI